jgi:hypothetical protein
MNARLGIGAVVSPPPLAERAASPSGVGSPPFDPLVLSPFFPVTVDNASSLRPRNVDEKTVGSRRF